MAFNLGDPAQFTKRSAVRRFRGQPTVIAQRPRPLIETLMDDEQPRVKTVDRREGDGEEWLDLLAMLI